MIYTRPEDDAKEEIFYATNRLRICKGKDILKRVDFINGEYTSESGNKKDINIRNDIIEAVKILIENNKKFHNL